ncbi:hypothetical protein ACHWQZ_G011678 [Mnemiopsis leidyi]
MLSRHTEDLNFTMEHPTHTNLYTKYSSCTTNSSKNSVIRSLTRRAYNLCSPQHLDSELQTVRHICLLNGFPPQRITSIMEETKTTPPPDLTPHTIYEISCLDCTSTYNGQTYRPLIHRMKEHERCHRLNNAYDKTLDKVKSATAHHSLTTGHRIAWNDINILKSLPSRAYLDLTEQAAIHIRNPSMNRTDSAPKCSSLWNPILPKIAATLKPTPSGIDEEKYFFRVLSYLGGQNFGQNFVKCNPLGGFAASLTLSNWSNRRAA